MHAGLRAAPERPLTAVEVAQEGAVLTEFSLIMRKLLSSVERKAQTMTPVGPVPLGHGPIPKRPHPKASGLLSFLGNVGFFVCCLALCDLCRHGNKHFNLIFCMRQCSRVCVVSTSTSNKVAQLCCLPAPVAPPSHIARIAFLPEACT